MVEKKSKRNQYFIICPGYEIQISVSIKLYWDTSLLIVAYIMTTSTLCVE